MVLIKPEDFNIVEDKESPEEIEHELIKDSVLEMTNTNFSYADESEVLPMGVIRRNAADITAGYEGKPVSRKKMESSWLVDHVHNKADENSSEGNTDDNESYATDSSGEDAEEEVDKEGSDNESGEEEEDSSLESDIEDDSDFKDDGCPFNLGLDTFNKSKNEGEAEKEKSDGMAMFHGSGKGIKPDIEKGKAIRNQLSTWETLLECRIKLQKGLLASNRLFQLNDFKHFRSKLETEEEAVLTKTYSGLSELMNVLFELQEVMLKSCTEYVKIKKEAEEKGNEKDVVSEEEDGPKMKKLKLSECSRLLEKHHSDYKPFRDTIIQKWNDKTRVLSGKISSSDLEQSTLKQIEQILCDRSRLVRRTQLKRSQYTTLGKPKEEHTVGENDKDVGMNEYDPEIFDDDDFYHKLLRDFLDRKTSDITDPTQLGRRWVELQKLRSKMKRKIDVRATKGRRLRFTVHNKLVNFMAPIPYNSWSNEAEMQLFSSLFGKAGSSD